MKSPEELQAAMKQKAFEDHQKKHGGAAVGSGKANFMPKLLANQGTAMFNGDTTFRRKKVAIAKNSMAKARARNALIERGERPDEPPAMRGYPSHSQYSQKCVTDQLEHIITHDGYLVYHPMYGVKPEKLSDEDARELNIDPSIFVAEGVKAYHTDPIEVDVISSKTLSEETKDILNDDGSVQLSKEEFTAMMANMKELSEKVESLEKQSSPAPKKWNNQITRLMNEGKLNKEDLEVRHELLGKELNKADIQDLLDA